MELKVGDRVLVTGSVVPACDCFVGMTGTIVGFFTYENVDEEYEGDGTFSTEADVLLDGGDGDMVSFHFEHIQKIANN